MPDMTQSNHDCLLLLSFLAWSEKYCTSIKSEKKDTNLNSPSLFRSLWTTFTGSTKGDKVEQIHYLLLWTPEKYSKGFRAFVDPLTFPAQLC